MIEKKQWFASAQKIMLIFVTSFVWRCFFLLNWKKSKYNIQLQSHSFMKRKNSLEQNGLLPKLCHIIIAVWTMRRIPVEYTHLMLQYNHTFISFKRLQFYWMLWLWLKIFTHEFHVFIFFLPQIVFIILIIYRLFSAMHWIGGGDDDDHDDDDNDDDDGNGNGDKTWIYYIHLYWYI